MQALGFHHLGDLYTEDHRVKRERALKERAPTRKGIPGLRAWLTRHDVVLVPLLRMPPPRWQAEPKDLIPGAVPTYQAEVVIGGRVAKTTRMETVYHGGHPIKVTTAMKHTMEAADWVPEFRVCYQPPGTVPSNTRLHRLLVALLGIQVQVNAPLHAQLWDDQHHVSLAQLQSTGVWAPTIVWMAAPPTDAYWHWAQTSQAPLVTVTAALPPCPWIAIAPAAVAKFKYPAECVTHECPGHPNKGPLYYSLNTAGTVPAELGPALHCTTTSGSTMGTWPSWRRTTGLPTPRTCWPPRSSRAYGSMTCRHWPLSAVPSPRWMLAWQWPESPRAGPRPTGPTWPQG